MEITISNKIIFGVTTGLLVLGAVVWWLATTDTIPAGWIEYQSQSIGFRVFHPAGMTLRYEEVHRAGFALMHPVQDEEADFPNGAWFNVSRFPLGGQTVIPS